MPESYTFDEISLMFDGHDYRLQDNMDQENGYFFLDRDVAVRFAKWILWREAREAEEERAALERDRMAFGVPGKCGR